MVADNGSQLPLRTSLHMRILNIILLSVRLLSMLSTPPRRTAAFYTRPTRHTPHPGVRPSPPLRTTQHDMTRFLRRSCGR